MSTKILQLLVRQFVPNFGTVAVVAALLFANRAGALNLLAPQASNTTMHYQGRLANATGAPINGSPSMGFRLYNTATGGTPLWSETYSGVLVTDGLFSVVLGSQTPLPASVFSQNTNLWLGIIVGADNEMTPREQLTAAPYAMNALTLPDGSVSKSKLDTSILKITMLDTPMTVLYPNTPTVPSDTTWTSLSLAAHIPSTARSVLIDMGVSPTSDTAVRLTLRKPGTVSQYSPRVESYGGWDFSQGWVNVNNRAIEYNIIGSTNANFFIQVVGYIE